MIHSLLLEGIKLEWVLEEHVIRWESSSRKQTDLVCHLRDKFMEVGHRFVDIDFMRPIPLLYISLSDISPLRRGHGA